MMEAVSVSVTSDNFYQSKVASDPRRYLYVRRHEKVKFCVELILVLFQVLPVNHHTVSAPYHRRSPSRSPTCTIIGQASQHVATVCVADRPRGTGTSQELTETGHRSAAEFLVMAVAQSRN
jgi:hypothetical protein